MADKEYIEWGALLKTPPFTKYGGMSSEYAEGYLDCADDARKAVKEAPDADVVSRGVFEQVKWERDMAMQQLEEHGIPFGGEADDVVNVVRCKDCVYFQPNFVETNNGERRPYTEEEKNSPLGMVTCDVGVNCGSRCERFDYWEDNRFPVWFQENDFCSYGKKKEQT